VTRVLLVIGTRPEAIKLAPVVHQLQRRPLEFECRVLVTGQHRELLQPMLDLFGVVPDYDLQIMRPRQSLTDVTSAVMEGVGPILEHERPDWVVVQGDTTTVMAASLAAFYRKIPVAHVEAGLRTFDKYSPFPEELNRRIAGVVADLHFVPTPWAFSNLLREGVPGDRILLTGNTGIDALRSTARLDFDLEATPLKDLPLDRRLVLVTAHRNENLGAGMERIAAGVGQLARRFDDVHVVYPLHLNPRARDAAFRHLDDMANVSLLEPLEYRPLVWLLERAHLVITDSGGLQEEAAGVGAPVLILRDTTERPEGVQAGIARLIGTHREAIVREAGRLLDDEAERRRMITSSCPYGDGKAARRIVSALGGSIALHDADDHVYEHPQPEHPLDALLRHATQELPRQYAEQVLSRARAARAVA